MSKAARKWQVELCDGQEFDSTTDLEPIGYTKGIKSEKVTATTIAKAADSMCELKKKRASEIGMAPFKSLLQTAFMMWMSGSSINIFSIMVTGMVVMNTLKSLFDVNNAFDTVNDGRVDLTQPKLLYFLGNCISIALAVYKCGSLGLLPTTSADWTWLLPIKQSTEYSVFVGSSLG
ncbi:hypothetical protein ABG067_000734 [Albugo candida]|uniref:ER membrane protein complex subunit 4 n=1 Tax=Albugo candida TaxID=65357 RepID=A0A024G1G6_9STRA|nr:unnamed protein product [Albugo candida]|eukprot:CCI40495.1 unnamed protein product [Albugo candida]